jgi:hypothetical protein
MVHSTQTVHLSCIKNSTISKWTELSPEPRHLVVPSGACASETISELMVCLAQTVHLSCADTNTVSKQKEERVYKTHISYELHRVRPEQYLSLWYVRRKLCTCFASRLALFLKKWASTWAPSPSSTIRYVQNDFWAYGTSSANHAPILHWHLHSLQMERREIPHDPHHLGVPSGASKTIYEPMVCSTQSVHLSYAKISTISK